MAGSFTGIELLSSTVLLREFAAPMASLLLQLTHTAACESRVGMRPAYSGDEYCTERISAVREICLCKGMRKNMVI